jgi:hypothetical protein
LCQPGPFCNLNHDNTDNESFYWLVHLMVGALETLQDQRSGRVRLGQIF